MFEHTKSSVETNQYTPRTSQKRSILMSHRHQNSSQRRSLHKATSPAPIVADARTYVRRRADKNEESPATVANNDHRRAIKNERRRETIPEFSGEGAAADSDSGSGPLHHTVRPR